MIECSHRNIPNTVEAEDYVQPQDLRSSMKLETNEEPFVDEEDGTERTKLNYTLKNNTDKEVALVFQVEYRTPDNKLVYEDTFLSVVKPNQEETGYEYVATAFDDGKTSLPQGTTHKLVLAEAVEFQY